MKVLLQTFMCACFVIVFLKDVNAQDAYAVTPDILVESKDLKISLVSNEHEHKFLSAKFESDGENLVINTFDVIRTILFYNEKNDLEMVVPVNADNVIIGRNMFEQELYRIEFQFEDNAEMVTATLATK